MLTITNAETAAQNYIRVIVAADYHMTPERAAAKDAFRDAIAAAYPHLDTTDVYDIWSAGGIRVEDAANTVAGWDE